MIMDSKVVVLHLVVGSRLRGNDKIKQDCQSREDLSIKKPTCRVGQQSQEKSPGGRGTGDTEEEADDTEQGAARSNEQE